MTWLKRGRSAQAAFVFLLSCSMGACEQSEVTGASRAGLPLTPVAATAEWPAALPEQEGIDDETLRTLVGDIRGHRYGSIHSLLVARHGRLVLEEYFDGWAASQPHTQQSDTKSVLSLVTGLAVERSRLRLDDKVLSFFPAYQPVASLDAFKQSLTVADLLTMRTGLDWSEAVYAGSPLQRLNDCRCDWLHFVLDWPMREPPGTRWEYVSGGAILLGGIVGVATRQRIDRFADELLFAPLGAEGVSWIQGLPDGLPHTGGGLYLRPRDMAKLGALIADGGRWQSRQIVPESWILESTRRVIRGPRRFGNHSADYGYLWWILSLADPMNPRPQSGDVIAAAGARGQWIFAVPSLGLVVVTTAENDDANWARPVDFLFTHIIGALTR